MQSMKDDTNMTDKHICQCGNTPVHWLFYKLSNVSVPTNFDHLISICLWSLDMDLIRNLESLSDVIFFFQYLLILINFNYSFQMLFT